MSDGGPVLEVPVAADESKAHVAIQLAAADSPKIIAKSSKGQSVAFKLLDLTPSDVNSL